MKPQHFAGLAVAAAVSLVAAIAVYSWSSPWTLSTAGEGLLFPNLRSDAARVARIEVTQGPSTVTLERSGDQWTLRDRGGFPAAAEKIRPFLTSLADAELAEPKTRSQDRYKLLELEDPQGKDANSRLVRLLDEKGAPLAEIILGKKRAAGLGAGKGGTYVRRPGDAQTWLVTTDISGGTGLSDWTKSRVFETAPDKISKLRIERANESAYEIVRDEAGEHKLADMPAGKKLKYVNSIDALVEASAFMEFEDVRRAGEAGGSDLGTASLETATGLKVTFKFRRDKDATWLVLSAAGDGEAKKAADDIQARANGWEFKILSSKADATMKRRDDLLEDSSS
jgi:hypothetical protein